MSKRFEELDYSTTAMGDISLRRRRDPALDVDVYEVKLGDEFLMSSLFTAAEIELARLGLAATEGEELDVLVGGLGLGYTAVAALADPRVTSLTVVEALDEVISWHRRSLLPDAAALTSDPRCRLVQGDFFARVNDPAGLDPDDPGRRFDTVLVDIDHTPHHLLAQSHGSFYTPNGLRRLLDHLRPDGVFGLWSDDPPDAEFIATLETVFGSATAHVVAFPNPFTGGESTNTVYVAR